MSQREEILRRVRAALADVPGDRAPDSAPRDYASQSFDDVVGHFCEMVADYRATVHRCDDEESLVADVVASVLADEDVARLVVPHDLPTDLLASLGDVEVVADGPDRVTDHRDLDACDAVVTTARVGIAATGTVVLDHAAGQGRRALTLVPDLHVCVVTADQVVADVPDGVALLDPRRPQTWISGPSATSDIELDRVEGVHGPRRLHVVVVGRAPPDKPSRMTPSWRPRGR